MPIVSKVRLFVIFISLCSAILLCSSARGQAQHKEEKSGCKGLSPQACLTLATEAMGGESKLKAIHNESLDEIGHVALMEQSYRQDPFITSYSRDQITIDFDHQRIADVQHSVWPEADPKEAESDVTLVTTPAGGVYKIAQKMSPCSAADLDSSEETLALGPERLLLTAAQAPDLHFEADEVLRSTPHTVLAFQWRQIPVRILLNEYTHLPDAVETIQQFRDFWYFWGDVHQKLYWDNWKLLHGIVYPTNQITERNGAILSSTQVLDLEVNQTLDEKLLAVDLESAQQSLKTKGWARNFQPNKTIQLQPGITFFPGSWNTTVIKQADGIVILETPISGTFTEGLFAEVHKMYPEERIKAVLSTSDSWPHVGGIRYDVAEKTPIYILDLNRPLLDRMLKAPHSIEPDALQKTPSKPDFKIVSGKTEIGTGANRVVLYPLRGASTERQYMVYFPEFHLLYASDTLVMKGDNDLYDPELVREVKNAVDREGLTVETIFAMHQSPVAWSKVVTALAKAQAS